jgi:hypothetical protein
LGLLVEPDNIEQESHEVSSGYNDGRLVGVVFWRCLNFGEAFAKAGMAINQRPLNAVMVSGYFLVEFDELLLQGCCLVLGGPFRGDHQV